MTSVNNSKNPFEALTKLVGGIGAEAGRAVGEYGSQTAEDINSIGKAVETGGFLGGVLQFYDKVSVGNHFAKMLDSATGPGALPPQLKEGVAAAVNYATGNPIFLKDLFDLATAPSQPGVPPAPANGVPGPNVDQLEGRSPPAAPGSSGRTGYSDSPAPPRSRDDIGRVVQDTSMPLATYMEGISRLRNDPTLKDKAPDIYAVLHDKNATLLDVNSVIVSDSLKRCPHLLNDPFIQQIREEQERITLDDVEIGGGAPPVGATAPSAPTEATAPAAPPAGTGQGDFSNFMQQAMGIFGQLAGPLGMGLQVIGGLLSNPIVSNFIAPLLVQGLNALVPGLGVALAPILPVALPMVGMALSGIGSSMAGGGGGLPDLGALGGAPGGQTPDAFGGILQSLLGGLGGGGGPAIPIGAIAG